jgi:Na+/H+ antiporter NhaD/arsenite permease-like protein
MIIGIQSQISYLRFATRLFTVALLGLALNFAVVALVYRRAIRLVFSNRLTHRLLEPWYRACSVQVGPRARQIGCQESA